MTMRLITPWFQEVYVKRLADTLMSLLAQFSLVGEKMAK